MNSTSFSMQALARMPNAWRKTFLGILAIAVPITVLLMLGMQMDWHDRLILHSGETVFARSWGDQYVVAAGSQEATQLVVYSKSTIREVQPGLQTLLGSLRGPWLAGFGACTLLMALCLTLRWRILMPKGPGQEPPNLWPLAVIWARSQIINLLPLSQIGGDAYRIERTRHCLIGVAPATAVIVVEKLVGLSALIAVAVAGLWISGKGNAGLRQGNHEFILFTGTLVGILTASLFVARRRLARRALDCVPNVSASILHRWQSVQPVLPGAQKLSAVLIHSFAVQIIAPACYWFIDRALGLDTPMWCYLVAIPTISLAQYLPIHIAGIGILEGGLWIILHSWAGRSTTEVLAISATARVLGLGWLAFLSLSFLVKAPLSVKKRSTHLEPKPLEPIRSPMPELKATAA